MDDWRAAALTDLRHHWSGAYKISYIETAGRWVAQRRDSHATMSAESAGELRDLIAADYASRPVRRDGGGE